MDGARKEIDSNRAQELSTLRKKATEYILQLNYKAALPAVEEALSFMQKHPESCEELKLTKDDMYILNCARCLCYVHEDVEKAEKILQNIEHSFEFKLPLLYFMFAKEFFRRRLLEKVKDYSEKFLDAYRDNLFRERGKTYYWIGTSIPIKYEQFNCTVSDLAIEVLEQKRTNGDDELDGHVLSEIYTTLEEVLFYTQTEDSIRNSFCELGSSQENSISANLSGDKVTPLQCKNNTDNGNDVTNCEGKKCKRLNQHSQTNRWRLIDVASQTNFDTTIQPQNDDSAIFLHKYVQAVTKTASSASIYVQTMEKKKSNAQVQVLIQDEDDLLVKMKEENENLKDKIKSLELQLQDKELTIEKRKEQYSKLREDSVIETTKLEVRLEILQNELTKLQKHHENDLKQVATLETLLKNSCIRNSNLQYNIYTQYEKKCNTMIKDLAGITQYLTHCSIPTLTECNEELKMWKDELCKTIYCKQLISAYQEQLKTECFKATCFNMPNLPDIPDCPIEARDLLHESFKPTMLHIIKNENMAMNNVNAAVKPVARPPSYFNNNGTVAQAQYNLPQFYLQGPNITYYRPMASNFPPGFSNPFQQPAIFPTNVAPIQPPPPPAHVAQIRNAPSTPLSLREVDDKSETTRSENSSFDRQSPENSVTSSCSNTPNIDWVYREESHLSTASGENNNSDCKIRNDLNMLSVSDIERLLNVSGERQEEEKPAPPLPLSSLMRLKRKKSGPVELKATASDDLLNLNILTKPPDAVLALGGKSFPIVYFYVVKNMPEAGEEELIRALQIAKERNGGTLDNLKQEEVLTKVRAIFKESKTRSSMRTAWDMAEACCSICNKDLGKDQKTITLECKHKFHEMCIKARLETSNSCPNCLCYIALNDEYPPLSKVWAN